MNLPFKKLVIATGNSGKLVEIGDLLSGLEIQLIGLRDLPGVVPADEDAPTLEGNAVKKAASVYQATGLPTLADDTGLEVDALGGAPGVTSARFAGPACDPAANRHKLLGELSGERNRRARFRTVVALVSAQGASTFYGVCEGRIARHERGTSGFGYDSLFVPSGAQKTFAEMDADEKNDISHRGKALRQFRAHLESMMSL